MTGQEEINNAPEPIRTYPWRAVDLIAVAVLTVLAFLLRAHNLDPSTLTHDDAWVAYVYRAGYSDSLIIGLASPGFVFLQKAWLGLVGFSELRAQLPSLVAGVVAPALAFVVLRKRVRWPFAILGGVLMAYVPIHIIYSQHVKQYTTEVLLGFAMLFLAWRIIDDPAPLKRWLLLAALQIAAIVISFPMAFVAASVSAGVICATWRNGARDRYKLGSLVFVGAFSALWYEVALSPRMSPGLRELWRTYAGEGRYLATDAGVAGWISSLFRRILQMLEWFSPFPAKLMLMTVTVLLLAVAIRRLPIFIMAIGSVCIAVALASLELAPLGGNRADMYLHAPLLVGLVVGLDVSFDLVKSWTSRARPGGHGRVLSPSLMRFVPADIAVALLVTAGIAVLLSIFTHQPPPYPLQDVRPLVEILDAEREPDDFVVIDYEAMYHVGLYSERPSHPRTVTDFGFRHYWVEFEDPGLLLISDPAAAAEYAETINEHGDRFWLLVSINPFTLTTRAKWDPMIDRLQVQDGWKLERSWSRENAVLEVWRID